MRIFLIFMTFFAFSFSSDIKSFKSEFIQSITSPEGSVISYSGELYTKGVNKAFWHYKTPMQKMIYFNDNEVLMIEPELEQVIISKVSDIPNIHTILNQAKSNNKIKTRYKDIDFMIEFENKIPKKISYQDKLDNMISIEFLNVFVNENLSDKLFEANVPNHFDILQQ